MREYTFLALVSVVVSLLIDRILGTRLTGKKTFWIFVGVMFCFLFVVNGYLTWRPIVLYGDPYFMNIRIFTIPVEDFLYGFSITTLSVVFWEYLKDKSAQRIRTRREGRLP